MCEMLLMGIAIAIGVVCIYAPVMDKQPKRSVVYYMGHR